MKLIHEIIVSLDPDILTPWLLIADLVGAIGFLFWLSGRSNRSDRS